MISILNKSWGWRRLGHPGEASVYTALSHTTLPILH